MPPHKLRRTRSGDLAAAILRVGGGSRRGNCSLTHARVRRGELEQLAARRGANIGTNQSLPLELFDLVVDRFDRERRTAAAVHALLQVTIDDTRGRDWRVRLAENFDERINCYSEIPRQKNDDVPGSRRELRGDRFRFTQREVFDQSLWVSNRGVFRDMAGTHGERYAKFF